MYGGVLEVIFRYLENTVHDHKHFNLLTMTKPSESHMPLNKIHPFKYIPLSGVSFLFLLLIARSLGVHIRVVFLDMLDHMKV